MARPEDKNSKKSIILEEIYLNCQNFQRFGPAPIRFRASIPTEEHIVFGDEISLDVMLLDGNTVIYVVDTETHLLSATFCSYMEKPSMLMYGRKISTDTRVPRKIFLTRIEVRNANALGGDRTTDPCAEIRPVEQE